jgi:hypothetical protein
MLSMLMVALQISSDTPRAVGRDSSAYQVMVRFPVTDTSAVFERPLGSKLMVQVHREVDAHGESGGWTIAVVRQPPGPDRRNLLYHSWAWHGPYPTDLFAWIHEAGYYPDERILAVYDYPYELRVRCERCTTVKTAHGVAFAGGTVEVGWRRTRKNGP